MSPSTQWKATTCVSLGDGMETCWGCRCYFTSITKGICAHSINQSIKQSTVTINTVKQQPVYPWKRWRRRVEVAVMPVTDPSCEQPSCYGTQETDQGLALLQTPPSETTNQSTKHKRYKWIRRMFVCMLLLASTEQNNDAPVNLVWYHLNDHDLHKKNPPHCVCACACVRLCVCACVCTHVRACVFVHACRHTCVHCMHTLHACVRMHEHTHASTSGAGGEGMLKISLNSLPAKTDTRSFKRKKDCLYIPAHPCTARWLWVAHWCCPGHAPIAWSRTCSRALAYLQH